MSGIQDVINGRPLRYMYETHLHTYPVSACGHADARQNLEFYKALGYDGVFITNHFLDGNINIDKSRPYKEKIEFYFSDYENALAIADEIGIKVFCGVEMSYQGTDFLVYGLDKAWFLSHPEIMEMDKRKELNFLSDNGALIIHAHPYREAGYIDHIRLYPRSVHGVEVINANRTKLENNMAVHYAQSYGFLMSAGSDNHVGNEQSELAGVSFAEPLVDEQDFINRIKEGQQKLFVMKAKKRLQISDAAKE